ncbi:efflux RND transporter periplasmic adaptor subunit [Halobacillus salinarum]|uniref:Efflux RND transporter periplasmic adaptor subunit n=1 Tax=Halobacillus salinarum TaxID=2932257 RepID=A0ABY4EP37_9BACI|nr:efflux RND transporter periplasmic adaptor subunit [Halobacillus salinarum]UOQ45377.1 efflux RND transporter periplasmic adaptor subunit [Halobacillus salinarum]
MKRVVTFVFLLAMLAACSSSNNAEEPEERITPVETAPITKGDFVVNREIVGRASTADSSPVVSKVPGEVVSMKVSKGDRVEKGDVIAVVDPGDTNSQVEMQQLSLEQAQKQLENAKLAKQQAQEGIDNAKKQVEVAEQGVQAQASQTEAAAKAAYDQYKQAKDLAEQTKKLVDEGTVPKVLYEQAQSRADQAYAQYKKLKGQESPPSSTVAQAEAQVDAAQQQLEQAEVGVDQAEIQVEQAQVQLNSAKDQSANQTVTAPSSGEVSTLEAGEGDMVTNQQPFATIVGLNPMTITAMLTPDQLHLFSKGKEMDVDIDTLKDNRKSKVTYVSSVPNDTGLYPVEATVNNDKEKIKPGMMAKFLLPETVVKDTLIVPTDAVIQDGAKPYVYKVVDDKAVKVTVDVQESQTDRTAVTGDITTKDQVITSGQLTLTDGGKVSIMKEEA